MGIADSFDKINAVRRIRQALAIDPNNIDALLELAALQKEAELKRKLLNKVLSIDPANPQAREMVLAADRAAMTGDASSTEMAAVSTVPHATSIAGAALRRQLEKPLRFRYSLFYRIVVFLIVAITACGGLAAVQDTPSAIVYLALVLLGSFIAWTTTSVAEVSGTGVRTYRLFGTYRHEIAWDDIVALRTYAMGHGVKLMSKEGSLVNISSQFSGYPNLIEILWQVRNDLFDLAKIFPAKDVNEPDLIGTFKKPFLSKYGLLLLAVLALLAFLALGFMAQCVAAAIFAVVVVYLWRTALWNPYWVKLEGAELSVRSFVKKQVVTVQQIKDIDMRTLYTVRGVAHTHIEIELHDGNVIRLSGFPEGKEIMYGVLRNWWMACQAVNARARR